MPHFLIVCFWIDAVCWGITALLMLSMILGDLIAGLWSVMPDWLTGKTTVPSDRLNVIWRKIQIESSLVPFDKEVLDILEHERV
jgi:hypothetical protein